MDGVHVGGGRGVGQVDTGATRLVDQALDQVVTAIHALVAEYRFEGLQPLRLSSGSMSFVLSTMMLLGASTAARSPAGIPRHSYENSTIWQKGDLDD